MKRENNLYFSKIDLRNNWNNQAGSNPPQTAEAQTGTQPEERGREQAD